MDNLISARFYLGTVKMNVFPLQVAFPVAKMRLIGAVVTALGFGALLYLASTNLQWLSYTSGLFLFLGFAEGLGLGLYEVRLVLPKLARNEEVLLWQILPLSAALIVLPCVLVASFYGMAESSVFLAYVVLSAIPAYLGVSGYHYNKFEKQNKLQVIASPYNFRYWTEPTVNYSDQFHYFLRDLQTKDASSMWSQAGYAKIYLRELKKRQDIEPEMQESLRNILNVLNSYRKRGLAILALILTVPPLLIAFTFTNGFGIFTVPFSDLADVTMPFVGGIFFFALGAVYYLMNSLKRKMTKILSQLDSNKLYSAKA
jgi:hypothetical protein